MADGSDAAEDFDLRLGWPLVAQSQPAQSAQSQPAQSGPAGSTGAFEPDSPTTTDSVDAPFTMTAQPDPSAGLDSAIVDIAAQFATLVDHVTAYRDTVAHRLSDLSEEVEGMESLTGGSLEDYGQSYERALSAVHQHFGDSAEARQWLEDARADMSGVVIDVARAATSTGEATRDLVAKGAESAGELLEAVRWVGERLRGDIVEFRNGLLQRSSETSGSHEGGPDGHVAALTSCCEELAESLSRLTAGPAEQRPEEARTLEQIASRQRVTDQRLQAQLERVLREVALLSRRDEQPAADHLQEIEERLEDGLLRLSEEINNLRPRDDKAITTTLARLTDEIEAMRSELDGGTQEELARLTEEIEAMRSELDGGTQEELARLTQEVQAMRRRLTLRGRTGATLDDAQLGELAAAVAEAVRASPDDLPRPPRRPTRGH